MEMKPYRVKFYHWRTNVNIVIQARSHEEAFIQALIDYGADYDEVESATITPIGEN